MNDRMRQLGQRWRLLGEALAVHERVGEINGGFAASAVTVSVFISIFPLLLLAIAIVGFVAAGDDTLAPRVVESLGLTGDAAEAMTTAIERASSSRKAASVIGLIGLAWSGSAVAVALQQAVRIPWQERSEGIRDRLRGMGWLVLAGIGLAGAIALDGAVELLPDSIPQIVGSIIAILVGLGAQLGLFAWMFWGLGTRRVPWRALVPGAVIAAVGFEVLKLAGTVVVPRLVANASAVYGSIGTVFAILAWLALFSRLLIYASTLNAVRFEAEAGTTAVPIRVPNLPGRHPVGATRGGVMVDVTDGGPAVGDPTPA